MNLIYRIRDGLTVGLLLFTFGSPVGAFPSTRETDNPDIEFARDVRPIFESHCISCHGLQKQESNFRLDLRSSAMEGGDFGEPAIVPGNADESPLIQYVSGDDSDLMMPPESAVDTKALTPQQINTLKTWIAHGAEWPDSLSGDENAELTTDHWSFQPMVDSAPPAIQSPLESFPLRNGIDHFIAKRLVETDLQPSNKADRVTLIRRLYLDMHGLLPTPEQVQAFTENASPKAYSKLVDGALASQHYGERWARHWLDIVRFGESTGFEVNRDRPNAYFYRDYVIDALNSDKSYRDFIIEQLAGDIVGVDEATGFLVGGANDIVKSPDINLTLAQRQDELADYVNTTSTTFLGLTVGCARCHNHKFDPILQRDFYSLQAVFAGVQHGERKLWNLAPVGAKSKLESAIALRSSLEKQIAEMRSSAIVKQEVEPKAGLWPMVNAKLNTDSFDPVTAKFVRFVIRRTNQSEPCLDELEIFSAGENVNVGLATAGASATSSGTYPNNAKHTLPHINDNRFGNDFSWISNTNGTGWVQVELARIVSIDRVAWARDRSAQFSDRLPIDYSIDVSSDGKSWETVSDSSKRKPFAGNAKEPANAFVKRLPADQAKIARTLLADLKAQNLSVTKLEQSIPVGYSGTFKAPEIIHRLYRGDPLTPREIVVPDTITVMGSLDLTNLNTEQERRLKLAKWIASPDNPLTARVIVNRVWQYHFGNGLVSTPSDFGGNGTRPSHPELLDWLALGFIDNDWSLKWLHREILMSSTYRQSSAPRTDCIAKDADCRLLWRFPPRRLEAEAIRDCVLQLSGKLNPLAGGPGFLLFKVDHENVHHYFPLDSFESNHFRRMIYMTKIRQEQDEVFGVFDCPDGGQTIPKRSRSTTALQALNLLNSKFMIEQASFLTERLKSAAGDEPTEQIALAFEWAFLRSPTAEEMADAKQLIEKHGLNSFCRALLNANEFLFVS